MNLKTQPSTASFRDPSGFVFFKNGICYRQINKSYSKEYRHLIESGLYKKLTEADLLISHEEIKDDPLIPNQSFKIIQPTQIAFFSYPYEWPFGMLKDAALCTLSIQRTAMEYGLSLKDSSTYNIQFVNGKPILIDSLSFELFDEKKPWRAYRQFCQHFLAPLALMAYVDIRLSQLLRVHIDGLPLDLTSHLLPFRTRFNLGLQAHIHLHSLLQKRSSNKPVSVKRSSQGMNKQALIGLIDSLEKTISKLNWNPGGTAWGDYYNFTNYSEDAFDQKKTIVSGWLDKINPKSVWDLGANDGTFSNLASDKDINTISFDNDYTAIEINYQRIKTQNKRNILPLLIDLTNPSPSLGWNNQERDSFIERAPANCIIALALIHHLAISNNVPLGKISDFFAKLGDWLIIEFVPKSDSQVKKLLSSREDIFSDYDIQNFEANFLERFEINEKISIKGTERTLYLMKKKK